MPTDKARLECCGGGGGVHAHAHAENRKKEKWLVLVDSVLRSDTVFVLEKTMFPYL